MSAHQHGEMKAGEHGEMRAGEYCTKLVGRIKKN